MIYLISRHCLAIHLDDPAEKFYLLCFMTKKLFALADNKCAVEGADAVMMQECMLGGHLYLQVVKEKLYSWLMALRASILKRAKHVGNNFSLNVRKYFDTMITLLNYKNKFLKYCNNTLTILYKLFVLNKKLFILIFKRKC